MALLDVQHVKKKIYKTRFQGNQVEALRAFISQWKADYVAIMGESGSGNPTYLNILAMLDKPTEGQRGTDTATIKNNQASSFRREKLRLCLSRPQSVRHLVCERQYFTTYF